jgi:hypothetical protein
MRDSIVIRRLNLFLMVAGPCVVWFRVWVGAL